MKRQQRAKRSGNNRGQNNIEDQRAVSITFAVIPAKAGIQWFMQYIPAQWE